MSQVEGILEFYKESGFRHDRRVGYVYVVKAENGLYKIGKTQNPKSRISSLQTSSPVKLDLFCLFYSSDMDTAEIMLHDMFEETREIGEWFRLTDSHIDDLNRREGDHILERCFV